MNVLSTIYLGDGSNIHKPHVAETLTVFTKNGNYYLEYVTSNNIERYIAENKKDMLTYLDFKQPHIVSSYPYSKAAYKTLLQTVKKHRL